jgi:hypothetical protein
VSRQTLFRQSLMGTSMMTQAMTAGGAALQSGVMAALGVCLLVTSLHTPCRPLGLATQQTDKCRRRPCPCCVQACPEP